MAGRTSYQRGEGKRGRSYEIGEPDDDEAEGRTEGEGEWIGGLFHQVCMMRCGFPPPAPAPNCGREKVKGLKHSSQSGHDSLNI